MSELKALTLSFLQSHAGDAANVLSSLSARDVGAFLETVPLRLCVPVVQSMPPEHATRAFSHMPLERVTPIIRELGPQNGALILRHLNKQSADKIIKSLPTHAAMRLRLLLKYPADSVGAAMKPVEVAVQSTMTVEQALQNVKENTQFSESVVFIADNSRRLQGAITVTELVQSPPDTKLSGLMKKPVPTVSPRASVRSLVDHTGWSQLAVLPVVEHDDRLVGMVAFRAMQQMPLSVPVETASAMDSLSEISTAYWIGLSGIAQMLFAPLTKTQARQENG